MIGALFSTYRLAIELAVLGVLTAALGAQTWRLHSEQTGRAQDAAAFSEQRTLASRATALAESAARIEEQRRAAALQGNVDEAEKKLAAARADIAIRDATAGRLQRRVADLVARAREAARNPVAAVAGAPADDPTGVLADVLGRCVARVRLLATVADERGTAGATCEQSYRSLTP